MILASWTCDQAELGHVVQHFLQMPHIEEEVGMLQYASFLFMCLRHELSELFFKQLVFNRSFLSAPNESCIFQSSFGVPFDNKRLRLTASATETAVPRLGYTIHSSALPLDVEGQGVK